MKKLIVLLTFCIIGFALNAQTKIANKETVFGKWTQSKSPYIIEGEAIVPQGKTLVIKPGVIIQFKTGENKDYSLEGNPNPEFNCGFLRVNGKIVAKGKKNKLIKFTRNGESGTWGNVSIYTKDAGNLLLYCWFEAAFYIRSIIPGDNATGAVTFNNASGTVKNCLFINNGWTAFNCKNGSNPKFINNTVVGNQYAIEVNTKSSPIIENSIIWDNKNTFYVNGGAQVNISYSLMSDLDQSLNIKDDGKNVIGAMPNFTDQNNNKYDLKKTSPAYKKGKGGANMGAL